MFLKPKYDMHKNLPNHGPDKTENNNRGEGQSLGAPVGPGDRVDDRPGEKKRHRVQTRGQVDVPHPLFAVHLFVQLAAHVARDARRERVQEERGRVQTAVSMDVEQAENGHE